MSESREPGPVRWPAEWEPHRATWFTWPHNRDTWPGRLAAVEAAFVEMVAALAGRERVCVTVRDEAHRDHVARRLAARDLGAGVEWLLAPTNDAWVRDHGAIFVFDADRELVALDFGFDAWGRKYPPWDLDDAMPAAMAAARDLPRFEADFVLEGGSVDGNGAGAVLTTESCLLHTNRMRPGEASRTKDEMERRLARWLGAEQVLWLPGGIEGDDTDGHVDDVARFVDERVIVAVRESDPSDPNHAILEANWARLGSFRDVRGRSFDRVALPMPAAFEVEGARCPASYANFYLANGVALVPVFDAPEDARALAILDELLPGRDVVPIPAGDLVVGLGACHCLTQQEPALPGVLAR